MTPTVVIVDFDLKKELTDVCNNYCVNAEQILFASGFSNV